MSDVVGIWYSRYSSAVFTITAFTVIAFLKVFQSLAVFNLD